ncbi:hypothetical protein [Bradyrhizobium lablabi]|uniref:hypothetical protein n=1 Tax=Bradyrhizobium lablabi TaxID=722472 RepID=UPI00090CB710|nr:hypothetical protein [Bradyrhizobium lablabi]SHM40993.1 hypothetical protein SAMN05444321_6249 [Bradyrhizobium lablabi]
MPTIAEVRSQYPQYSDMSDTELAGALHDKFYSDMPADQFAEKIGLKPDKYAQAAIDEQADLKAKGVDTGAGYTRRLAHGATLGADSTVLAGVTAPIEAIKRGVGLGEGYNYAKAREDQIMNDARANTGALGGATEMLGGGVAGGALAPFGATRFLSSTAPSLLGRTAAFGADSAALGGIAGFNEGNGLSERLGNAGQGAIVGGLVGGALPAAGAIAKGVASPFISNLMAQINPRGYGEKQIARGIMESGRPTADIANDVAAAANEGQGVFTVADAMGNSGQRMLSTVARAPGEGRTAVVNALEGRQGTQGRRVSNALAEGFAAPETAAQTEARLTAQRGTDADAAFSAVRNDAGRVDLVPAINTIDRTIGTGPGQTLNAANDSIESVLRPFRERLARVNPDDFEAVQRIRSDMADTAQNSRQNGFGNRARLISQSVRELDRAMESASNGYRAANAEFAQASRNIEAVQTGRQASTRGRSEDTIPAYQALSPEGQGAFRSGYADPLIANTQGAAFGANKARPLLNDAFQAEAGVMAPGNPLMQRRIGREQTMFETRNQALGNSKTADNFADADAMGALPSLVGQVLSGNWSGAARSVISAGSNVITGNTPAVRAAVADILLQHGANVTPAALDRMVGETIRKIQTVQRVAMNGGRVAAGVAAEAPEATKKPKRVPLFNH